MVTRGKIMKWISVQDKIPSCEDQRVLLFSEKGHGEINIGTIFRRFYACCKRACSENSIKYTVENDPERSGWHSNNCEYDFTVTHWMPLPNQPERLSEKTSNEDTKV